MALTDDERATLAALQAKAMEPEPEPEGDTPEVVVNVNAAGDDVEAAGAGEPEGEPEPEQVADVAVQLVQAESDARITEMVVAAELEAERATAEHERELERLAALAAADEVRDGASPDEAAAAADAVLGQPVDANGDGEPDAAPASGHWYTRPIKFGRR